MDPLLPREGDRPGEVEVLFRRFLELVADGREPGLDQLTSEPDLREALGERVRAYRVIQAATRASATLALPRKVDRYLATDVVGEGGLGIVLRAFDPRLKRTVAIKLVRGGAFTDADRRRFRRELQLLARLEHRSIVRVLDGGDHEGVPFLVMDYLSGGTLAERLRARTMTLDAGVSVLASVARALAYAHERGITHRDVKPSNILFDEAGEAALADFGLARDEASQFTASGVAGTYPYLAPEVAEGGEAGRLSDVYGLGAVLYELLGGRPPYEGTPESILRRLASGPPPRLPRGAPRALVAVCETAMARATGDRYPSATAFADDLDRWLRGESVQARGIPAWRRASATVGRFSVRHKWVLAVSSAIVAGAFVVGRQVEQVAAEHNAEWLTLEEQLREGRVLEALPLLGEALQGELGSWLGAHRGARVTRIGQLLEEDDQPLLAARAYFSAIDEHDDDVARNRLAQLALDFRDLDVASVMIEDRASPLANFMQAMRPVSVSVPLPDGVDPKAVLHLRSLGQSLLVLLDDKEIRAATRAAVVLIAPDGSSMHVDSWSMDATTEHATPWCVASLVPGKAAEGSAYLVSRVSGAVSEQLILRLVADRERRAIHLTPVLALRATSIIRAVYADVTGDGLGDLLVGCGDGEKGRRVLVAEGTADPATFGMIREVNPEPRHGDVLGLVAADVDEDGVQDIVYATGQHRGYQVRADRGTAPAQELVTPIDVGLPGDLALAGGIGGARILLGRRRTPFRAGYTDELPDAFRRNDGIWLLDLRANEPVHVPDPVVAFPRGTLDTLLFGPSSPASGWTWTPVTCGTITAHGEALLSGLVFVRGGGASLAGWRIADVTQPQLALADLDDSGDLEVVECAHDLVVHGLDRLTAGADACTGFFHRLSRPSSAVSMAELGPLIGRVLSEADAQRLLATELCWQATLGEAVPAAVLADASMSLLRAGSVEHAADLCDWALSRAIDDPRLSQVTQWAAVAAGQDGDPDGAGNPDVEAIRILLRRLQETRDEDAGTAELVERFGPGVEARWTGGSMLLESDPGGLRAPTATKTPADPEGRALLLRVEDTEGREWRYASLAAASVPEGASWTLGVDVFIEQLAWAHGVRIGVQGGGESVGILLRHLRNRGGDPDELTLVVDRTRSDCRTESCEVPDPKRKEALLPVGHWLRVTATYWAPLELLRFDVRLRDVDPLEPPVFMVASPQVGPLEAGNYALSLESWNDRQERDKDPNSVSTFLVDDVLFLSTGDVHR